jgi:hypothetical protein
MLSERDIIIGKKLEKIFNKKNIGKKFIYDKAKMMEKEYKQFVDDNNNTKTLSSDGSMGKLLLH